MGINIKNNQTQVLIISNPTLEPIFHESQFETAWLKGFEKP